MAEVKHSVDPRFSHKDLSPYRVTDYKLYPADFRPIQKPALEFDTSAYVMTGFHIKNKPYTQIIQELQRKNHHTEYEHIVILDNGTYFVTKKVLTGESGIGFKVMSGLPISDVFHTHSVRPGENEDAVNLFSADDLYKTCASAIDRMWLVTPKNVWALINLYGDRYYYEAQAASREMGNGLKLTDPYDVQLAKLIAAVQRCELRLYKSTNRVDYTLIS